MMDTTPLDFAYIRSQIVGIDSTFQTPFGRRIMTYCDYTASGRCLRFIEEYIMRLQRIYANTHTEDDVTGRSMTHLLHEAEDIIKRAVNAGPHGKIIGCGYGSTAAIEKFQQILGVAWPPAVRNRLQDAVRSEFGQSHARECIDAVAKHRPVVIIGPYEHHSNEITWREGYAEVCKVALSQDGGIDLAHLEELLQRYQHSGRLLIGSFSAASNVTGMQTDVHALAALLHRYGALACFDFAAGAPYVTIDMNPPGSSQDGRYLDAVFISPHKFIGGPGSNGILVFNDHIYPHELGPTVAGGGTVDYVGQEQYDFSSDIETREKAGTPGVLQTMKAALVFQLKERLGIERIERCEREMLQRAFRIWAAHPDIEILGNQDPERRIAIVSFTIRDPWGTYLHPKFITSLLNDLFGIQSRAGCSCAGPYGHTLLGIDTARSARYREAVQAGYSGLKPGWCRVGFHYCMDDAEVDYIIEAVQFIADNGHKFLRNYDFDIHSGGWSHRNFEEHHEGFSIDQATGACSQETAALPIDIRTRMYESYLKDARRLAEMLPSIEPEIERESSDRPYEDLIFFSRPKVDMNG